MRFRKNVFSIAVAAVFIALMLLGFVNMVIMSYDSFSADGMEWIFIISMVIAVLLLAIVSYMIHEKAALKGIQKESGLWIIIEGIIVVGSFGLVFYNCLSTSVECGIWFGCCLLCVYGICRLMGGRLCGLAGIIFGAFLYLFPLMGGHVIFDSTEMLNVLTFLGPFLAFLLITKLVIPQFAKNSIVVVLALLVLSVIFGTVIVINPISCVLCIGCVISLIFTSIRTVDTTPTKGVVMAGILFVGSLIGAFGVSVLLDMSFMSLFTVVNDPGFDAAEGVFSFGMEKAGNMFTNVLFHSFGYGLFPAFMLLFSMVSGYAVIRRKLSEIAPLMLSMIALTIGYVISGAQDSHNYYLTYMLAVFSAYGIYNMLLPEFLGRFQEDEEDMFDVEDNNDTGAIPSVRDLERVEGKVANENHESASSDSVSEASDYTGAPSDGSPSVPGTGVSKSGLMIDPIIPSEDTSHFQEWRVSEEFVRDEKLKRARQAEREKSYQEAKARLEAEKEGTTVDNEVKQEDPSENIQFVQPVTNPEVSTVSAPAPAPSPAPNPTPAQTKTSAPTPEPEPIPLPDLPDLDDDKPKRIVFVQQDVGQYLEPQIPGLGEDLIPTPENVNSDNIVLNHDSTQEDSEMFKSLELNPQHEGREMELSESHRMDTDSIVMSGYQNSPDQFGAEDLLSAIIETEVPTVDLPDVPPLEESNDTDILKKKVTEEEQITDEQLSEVTASFAGDMINSTPNPGEDAQLDDLLERLDMSDSIKRMNASAREDLADVIEQEQNKNEDEVVLVAEDYGFGSQDGEYGEVPTVSDLEDRWRAEQALSSVPEDQIPDVVSPEDPISNAASPVNPISDAVSSVDSISDAASPEDEFAGFDFDSQNYYEEQSGDVDLSTATDSMHDMVSSDTINTDESMLMQKEEPSENLNMDLSDFTSEELLSMPKEEPPVADQINPLMAEPVVAANVEAVPEPDFAPAVEAVAEPDVAPVVEVAPEPVVEPAVEAVEEPVVAPAADKVTPFVPEVITRSEAHDTPNQETPSVEPVTAKPDHGFESISFMDLGRPTGETPETSEKEVSSEISETAEKEPSVAEAETATREPVVNHTEESPVYQFTRKDDSFDSKEEGVLGIPKPGDKTISSYVNRYAAAEERQGKIIAASMDRYEKMHEKEKAENLSVHTEEVVARNGGGARSYHRIILK
ncbi:MAG: hypothetical protein IKQ97_04565 [Eubacterium sp.]|nr:hypothetical protein [Eubacterium sp.]